MLCTLAFALRFCIWPSLNCGNAFCEFSLGLSAWVHLCELCWAPASAAFFEALEQMSAGPELGVDVRMGNLAPEVVT